MKLIILLTTALVFKVHGAANSQTITFSGKNIALKLLIEEVQKQSGYLFFYNTATLNGTRSVTIDAHALPLKIFLDSIFHRQPLTYSIRNKTIFLSAKSLPDDPLPLAINQALFGSIDVKGIVVNQNNEPVAAATVTVKGKNRAVQSDDNGRFEIKGIDNDASLLITAVNYQPVELPINNRTDLLIKLTIKPAALQEVVISNGYLDIPRERSTGSFEVIKNEELNRKVGPDLMSRLEGVSGIFFDRRVEEPGRVNSQQVKLTIRGLNTLTPSMEDPLIILDNFPYVGDLRSINPNDIESVTILRDAASASIWGAQSANGVIVINTKKGKFNQPLQITLTNNFSITTKPDLFRRPFVGASDFIDLETFLFDKGYYDYYLSSGTYPAVTPVVEILELKRKGLLTPEQAAERIDRLRSRDVRDDFSRYVYRNAFSYYTGLEVSGGSDKHKYNISGSLGHNPTFMKGEEQNKYNFLASNTYRPVKNLTTTLLFNFSKQNIKANSLGNMNNRNFTHGEFVLPSYYSFLDDQGNAATLPYRFREGYTDTVGGGQLLDWKFRPLDELKNRDQSYAVKNLSISLDADYQLLRGLSAGFTYQYTSNTESYTGISNLDSYNAREQINDVTNLSSTDPALRYPVPIGAIRSHSNTETTVQFYRIRMQFRRTFGLKHDIDVFASADAKDGKSITLGGRMYGYNVETNQSAVIDPISEFRSYIYGTSRIQYGNSVSTTVDRSVSALINLSYQFDKRYIVTFSSRKDGANVFGVKANDRWNPLWHAGLGWNISNEKFFKVPFIDQLTTRFNFGYRGNVNTRLSAFTIISHESSEWSIFGLPKASINSAANPELRWERLGSLNIGTNISLLKNRISLSLDFFRDKSTDLIHYLSSDPTTGMVRLQKNIAGIVAKGYNLALTTQNLVGPFKWSTTVNLIKVKNRIDKTDSVRYPQPKTAYDAVYMGSQSSLNLAMGYDPYSFITYRFAGLDPQTGDPMGYLNGKPSKDYQAIMNQPWDSAIVEHGSANPLLNGNLNNTFSYKSFQLFVGISFKLKYYFQKEAFRSGYIAKYDLVHPDYLKRWKQPGDEKITHIPSLAYPDDYYRDEFYAFSSVNVLPADNIRLQNIQLSYVWDAKGRARKFMRGVIASVNVENLGFIWLANDEKIDPTQRINSVQTPQSIGISGQIKVNF